MSDDGMHEVEDALETTDQLHNDIVRLKRLGIMTSQEDQTAQEQLDEIVETLTEKLGEEAASDDQPPVNLTQSAVTSNSVVPRTGE